MKTKLSEKQILTLREEIVKQLKVAKPLILKEGFVDITKDKYWGSLLHYPEAAVFSAGHDHRCRIVVDEAARLNPFMHIDTHYGIPCVRVLSITKGYNQSNVMYKSSDYLRNVTNALKRAKAARARMYPAKSPSRDQSCSGCTFDDNSF